MQQIKCEACQEPRFFGHLLQGIPMLTCTNCGQAYLVAEQQELPAEETQTVEEPEEIESQPPAQPVSKDELMERVPDAAAPSSKKEFERLTGEKAVVDKPQKPGLRKVSPEERERYLAQLEEEGK